MSAAIALAEIERIAAELDMLCGDDEVLFADMLHGETDLFEIVGKLHARMASDQELVAGITERQAELAERKRRLSARIDAAKASVGKFLRAAKLPKIELAEATYSVRDGKPSLTVVNADAVPEGLTRIKREPDKTAINAAFAGRDDLPNWLQREPATDVISVRKK
jgi:hypothetical protein